MNTRSKKRKDVYSNSDSIGKQQSQNKTRKTTQSDTDDSETIYENFTSPTFNIHIHVPYYDSNNSKLFLPRIQPIINLHFDEIARKIESKDKKNEKSLYEIFQNILTKVSPKFGVVKFHFKNHSKDIQESDKNNVTPCSSRTPSNELNTGLNFDKTQNIVTRSSKRVVTADIGSKINRSNNKDDENHAPIIYELDKDVKLKNAVVVLTDICKTKYYKNYIRTHDSVKSPNNDSEDSCNFESRVESTHGNKQKNEKIIREIGTDDECCRSDSFASKCNNRNLGMPEKYLTDSFSNEITEKSINSKSDIGRKNEKSQNLVSLVEGWNFSDILNRFHIKQSEYCDNSTIPSNDIIENESCDIEKSSYGLDFQLNKKNEYLKEDTKFGDIELNVEVDKNEIELNEEDNPDGYVSDDEENLSLLQYQNETADDFFTDKFVCETKEDIKQEFASNSSEVFDLNSGDCKNTSGEKESLEVITDWETVKSDLSSTVSNAVENKFEIQERNKSSISNVKLPEVYFELIKKEMKRRGIHFPASGEVQQSLKSEKSNVEIMPTKSKSSPKKQKRSSEQLRKSGGKKIKPSKAEDFIPLNSSGPTKFVVASLNAVKYSDEREAKNFKRDMLFGKRVNRFSRSDELRIYQLKKEAVQKSLNK